MPPTNPFRPVLFLGLGSTGSKIVSNIKQRIDRSPIDPIIRKFYQYICVDSSSEKEVGIEQRLFQTLHCGVHSTTRAISNLASNETTSEEFRQWWPRNPDRTVDEPWNPAIENLTVGAGGLRPVGRLLLKQIPAATDLGDTLRGVITRHRETLDGLEPMALQNFVLSAFEVYVFGLLAGGTCSGILTDVTELARQTLGKAGAQPIVTGVFMLGDVCYGGEGDPNAQQTNTSHALAEIAFLHSHNGRAIAHAKWPKNMGDTDLTNPLHQYPFDSIIVVGAENDRNQPLTSGLNGYIRFVAEYFSCFFSTEDGRGKITKHVDDEALWKLSAETSPYRPMGFQRIGSLTVCVPTEKIKALATSDIRQQIGDQVFKSTDETVKTRLSRLIPEGLSLQSLTGAQFTGNACKSLFSITQRGWEADVRVFDSKWTAACDQADAAFAKSTATFEMAFAALCSGKQKIEELQLSPAVKELVEKAFQIRSQWLSSVDAVLAECLGKLPNAPVPCLATLEFLLTSTESELRSKQASVQQDSTNLQKQTVGDTGSQKRFKTQLERIKTNQYPGMLAKVFSAGPAGLDQVLAQHARNQLDRTGLRVLDVVLIDFKRRIDNELKSVKFCIKACKNANEDRSEVAREFVAADRYDVRIEMETNQNKIREAFVRPLLSGTTGGQDTLLTRCVEESAGRWASILIKEHDLLMTLFQSDSVLLNDAIETQREPFPGIRQRLGTGLVESLRKTVSGQVAPRIHEITVWDAFVNQARSYAEEMHVDLEKGLDEFHKLYFNGAQPFARRSDDALEKTTKIKRKYYCFANEADAEKAFENAGLPNPKGYLRSLCTSRFSEMILINLPDRHDEFYFMSTHGGNRPTHFYGFESVQNLLNPDENAEPPLHGHRNWTDARFPAWIKEWNAMKNAKKG